MKSFTNQISHSLYYKLKITTQDSINVIEQTIDEMTWRQFINNALSKGHGIFGESIDYEFLNISDRIAFVRVGSHDHHTFTSALTTYVSGDELLGFPLVVEIIQETVNPTKLSITDDDKIWLKSYIESAQEDLKC
ncbi:HFR015Cp [Eremothecium sinecaudum]|uniref:HFR015Cp n=1 Tax=Eremothecium sinecaudum TaxID=45286 RepID=A0A120K2L1_9SACH|nr:HFR015Cp [Eremothecium sinecaudum]AMD21870.1 HFR015Cp [Eremothecium sinecaudum]